MQLEQAASALEAIKLVRPDPEAVARANRAAAAGFTSTFCRCGGF
jgi:hypothetical protein